MDAENEQAIYDFLKSDPQMLKKFRHIIKIIMQGLRVSDLYDKEDINNDAKDVTAMKLGRGTKNARIYCKEFSNQNGIFHVVVAELLPKKASNKIKSDSKQLILKVANYEYEITEQSEESVFRTLEV
jgi:hypothetical protein